VGSIAQFSRCKKKHTVHNNNKMGVTHSVSSEAEWRALAELDLSGFDTIVITESFTFAANPPLLAMNDARLFGNGHTITLAPTPETPWGGLVSLNGGSIWQLSVDARHADISQSQGVLAEAEGNGSLYGCRAVVSLSNPFSAGLVGTDFGVSGNEIVGCHVEVLGCTDSDCAGIASSYLGSSIRFCTVTGSATGTGFAGIANFASQVGHIRTVSDCFVHMTVMSGWRSGAIMNVHMVPMYETEMARCASNVTLVGWVLSRPTAVFNISDCYSVTGSMFYEVVFNEAGPAVVTVTNCYLASENNDPVENAVPWAVVASAETYDAGSLQIGLISTYRNGSGVTVTATNPKVSFSAEAGSNSFEGLLGALELEDEYAWSSNVWAVSGDRLVLRTFQNVSAENGNAINSEFRDELFDADAYATFDDVPVLHGKAYLRVRGADSPAYEGYFTNVLGAEQLMTLDAAARTIVLDIVCNVPERLVSASVLAEVDSPDQILSIDESATIQYIGDTTRSIRNPTFNISVNGNGTGSVTFTPNGLFARMFDTRPTVAHVTVENWPPAVPCFAGWMPIRMGITGRLRPVSELRPGHVIRDSKNVLYEVRDVTKSTTQVVTQIAPGALGPGIPSGELVLTPNHLVHMPSKGWLRAADVGVTTRTARAMPVYHICVDDWTDIDVHGVRVETCAWRAEHHAVRPVPRGATRLV